MHALACFCDGAAPLPSPSQWIHLLVQCIQRNQLSTMQTMAPALSTAHSVEPAVSTMQTTDPTLSIVHSVEPTKSTLCTVEPAMSTMLTMDPALSTVHTVEPTVSILCTLVTRTNCEYTMYKNHLLLFEKCHHEHCQVF